jgi:hypothetical protein
VKLSSPTPSASEQAKELDGEHVEYFIRFLCCEYHMSFRCNRSSMLVPATTVEKGLTVSNSCNDSASTVTANIWQCCCHRRALPPSRFTLHSPMWLVFLNATDRQSRAGVAQRRSNLQLKLVYHVTVHVCWTVFSIPRPIFAEPESSPEFLR